MTFDLCPPTLLPLCVNERDRLLRSDSRCGQTVGLRLAVAPLPSFVWFTQLYECVSVQTVSRFFTGTQGLTPDQLPRTTHVSQVSVFSEIL